MYRKQVFVMKLSLYVIAISFQKSVLFGFWDHLASYFSRSFATHRSRYAFANDQLNYFAIQTQNPETS